MKEVEAITFRRTCEILRVSRWTLGRLVADPANEIVVIDGIPGWGDSGKRISRASLEAFLTRAVEPKDPNQEPLMLPDTTLTLVEVAEKYKLSKQLLREMARAGKVEHLHFGRSRTMTPEQVEKLLASHREGSTAKEGDTRTAAVERARERLGRRARRTA